MKRLFFSTSIIVVGLLFNTVFVYAGYDCYVDEDAGSEEDGSEDNPYKNISKALEKGCDDIYVAAGSYSDNILLEKDVKIKGKGDDYVSITGLVEMEYGSEIEDVEIKGEGIKVRSGASVEIIDVYIRDAGTGIETVDGGTLTIRDSKIKKNGKGLYIQKGKDINITSSEISENEEEGIDIRSNVDGVVSGNVIEDNGESGIEIILGKSEMKITNNKIEDNGSSGIATQFYDFQEKIGAISIRGNTISENSNYGIDCKTPSGGNSGDKYWSESMSFVGNSIFENKKGDFAPYCKLSNIKIENATKTEEEIAAEKAAKAAALEAERKAEEKALAAEEERLAKEKAEDELENEKKDLETEIAAAVGEEKKPPMKTTDEEEENNAGESLGKFRFFAEIFGGIIVATLLIWLFLSGNTKKKNKYSSKFDDPDYIL